MYQAFLDILNRDNESEEKPDSTQNVRPDMFTVRDRVVHLRTRLKEGRVRFSDLFSYDSTRMEKVVTFMALLEMMYRLSSPLLRPSVRLSHTSHTCSARWINR